MTAGAEAGGNRSIWSAEDVTAAADLQQPEVRDELAALERRARMRIHAQWAILVIALGIVVVRGLMIGSAGYFFPSLVAIAWPLIWVGALGLVAGRTLPMRRLFGFVMLGYFLVPPLVVLATAPALAWFSYDVGVGLVVPIAEEVLKAAPLVILVLGARRDTYGPRSVIDYGLAGFAVGGGFWIHENVLWERIGGVVDVPLSLVAPWLHIDGPYFSGTHPAWTALIGLGIGTMVVLRGRWLSWVVALVALAVSTLEHAGWNYQGRMDLLGWTLHGRVVLALLLLATVGAMVHGFVVSRWATARDEILPGPRLRMWPWRRRWWRAAEYTLLRAQVHLAAWQRAHVGSARPVNPAAAPLLVHLGSPDPSTEW